MNTAHPQIPLHFQLQESFTFENFVKGDNDNIIEPLQRQLTASENQLLYLWGPVGAGCSHLLQAACHLASAQQRTAIYLPMEEMREFDPALLEGIEGIDLVCLDHLDAVAGRPDWEEALFHFFNRVVAQQTALLVGAAQPPRGVGIALADLVSRLCCCTGFKVAPLSDANKIILLREKAEDKGMQLTPEVAQYILNRSERGTGALLKILDDLDHLSLSAGRRLTIPFIKEVMHW